MNKPNTSRQLELRSDWDDVRCAGHNGGGKAWPRKRRRVKKTLHKTLRHEGKKDIAFTA